LLPNISLRAVFFILFSCLLFSCRGRVIFYIAQTHYRKPAMKNSTKLFFYSTLMLSLSLAGCYYPYEEETALPAQPAASTVYSGYVYSGYGWPVYPWPYYYGPYYGPSFYSGWGPSWHYYPSRRWQSAPPYRPAKPFYRPGGPQYRPEWRGGRGGGPRPSNAPAYRPDGPRYRPPDAGQSYPSSPMPSMPRDGSHGRR
jgi:hypothetical protein